MHVTIYLILDNQKAVTENLISLIVSSRVTVQFNQLNVRYQKK